MCPELPYDVFHRIYTHCNLYTKAKLALRTNKAIFGHRCTPTELADLKKIESSSRLVTKLFFRAIVTNDNEAFVQELPKMVKLELVYGLRLAIRYGNCHVIWVLLALCTLEGISDVDGYVELLYLAICQLDANDLKNIAKFGTFATPNDLKSIVFFRDLLKTNNDRFYQEVEFLSHDALVYGLQLAGKCGYRHGAMILLSCDQLNANLPPEIKEIIATEEKRRTLSELADLAKIRNSQADEKRFFQSILAKDAKGWIPLDSINEAAQIFGLHLALQYGSSSHAWLLLAWGELDNAECKELIDEAKSGMTQTEHADIARIHKSNSRERTLYREIIANEYIVAEHLEDYLIEDINAFDFGLQLAIRRGNIEFGRLLLGAGQGKRRERNFKIGNDAAEESAEYMLHWEAIQEALYSYENESDDVDSDSEVHDGFDDSVLYT